MTVARIDGVEIAYEMVGEGRPLVFLHCWTGNRMLFLEQVERFSGSYSCLLLDFPGHGESGETEEYTVETFGELTAGLLGELEVEKAAFVGHSLGGMVSLYLALEHPELVEALVLLDTTAHLSGFVLQRILSGAVVVFGHLGIKPVRAAAAALAATHPLASPRAKALTARECGRVPRDVMTKTIYGFRNFDCTDRLEEIGQPALVLVGDTDILTDPRHARCIVTGIPRSALKVIRGAGHMAIIEKPDEVNEEIADFLDMYYPPVEAKPGRGPRRGPGPARGRR